MSDFSNFIRENNGVNLFESLVGQTIRAIEVREDKEEVKFSMANGKLYSMFHEQDCCENVYVEDVCGDLEDLIGTPLTQSEVTTSDQRPFDLPAPDYKYVSQTWTFYKMATNKGSVTIRWYGSSNGYYSENVKFAEMDDE